MPRFMDEGAEISGFEEVDDGLSGPHSALRQDDGAAGASARAVGLKEYPLPNLRQRCLARAVIASLVFDQFKPGVGQQPAALVILLPVLRGIQRRDDFVIRHRRRIKRTLAERLRQRLHRRVRALALGIDLAARHILAQRIQQPRREVGRLALGPEVDPAHEIGEIPRLGCKPPHLVKRHAAPGCRHHPAKRRLRRARLNLCRRLGHHALRRVHCRHVAAGVLHPALRLDELRERQPARLQRLVAPRAQRVERDVELIAASELRGLRPENLDPHRPRKRKGVIAVPLAHRAPESGPNLRLSLGHVRRSTRRAQFREHLVVNLHVRRARFLHVQPGTLRFIERFLHHVLNGIIESLRRGDRHFIRVRSGILREPLRRIGPGDVGRIVRHGDRHVVSALRCFFECDRINAPCRRRSVVERHVLRLEVFPQGVGRDIDRLVAKSLRVECFLELVRRAFAQLRHHRHEPGFGKHRCGLAGRFRVYRFAQESPAANAKDLDRRRGKLGKTFNHDVFPRHLLTGRDLPRSLTARAEADLRDALRDHVTDRGFCELLARHAARYGVHHAYNEAARKAAFACRLHDLCVLEDCRSIFGRFQFHAHLVQQFHRRRGVFRQTGRHAHDRRANARASRRCRDCRCCNHGWNELGRRLCRKCRTAKRIARERGQDAHQRVFRL